jgi:uncharacterized protein DUF4258
VSKDDELKCRWVGKAEKSSMTPAEERPVPPSPEFARSVALSILGGVTGCYRPTNHFAKQMTERDFDVFDIEYVIRNGSPVGEGVYSEEHKDHKYAFRGLIDGTEFDAVFSLCAQHDFIKAPLMKLITGCWKTKTGRRARRY